MTMLLFILATCVAVATADIEQDIQDRACNASTRPVHLDANEPWLIGPYDYTYENRTYAPDMLCEWHIRMEEGGAEENVWFNWFDFEVEDCVDCSCDAVSVYDGPDDQSPLIGSFCGDTVPDDIISTGRDVFVRWTTNEGDGYRGFMARYGGPHQEIACTAERPEVYTAAIGGGGIFYSPEYPNNYPNSANCRWQFNAENNEGRVRVTMLDFATDDVCQPGLDRLDLYDGTAITDPRLVRHTGRTNYFPAIIESQGPQMLAHFNSDLTLRFRGFFGIWEVVE